ncbi:MAG: hypothetical protein IPH45_08185 [Bacteroidales bacterium]|nr:hypothetical protein [Bacteroidales bacterium]
MVRCVLLIGDGCKDQGDGFLFIFLAIIYIISFIIIQIRSFINIYKHKDKYDFTPMIITLLLVVAITLSFNQESFESTTILKAKTFKHHTLNLRKNNTFKIQIRYVEASCFFTGEYQKNKDTLMLLDENIENKTDGAFCKKYLVNNKLNLLFPVEKGRIIQDSMRILTIEKKESATINTR